jgi:hypothetical protein
MTTGMGGMILKHTTAIAANFQFDEITYQNACSAMIYMKTSTPDDGRRLAIAEAEVSGTARWVGVLDCEGRWPDEAGVAVFKLANSRTDSPKCVNFSS